MIDNKIILYLALVFAVIADCIHGFYYIGTGLFFLLISLYLFIEDNRSFIKFVLLWLASFNLFKEIFFDPLVFTKIQMLIIVSVIVARLFYKPKTY